MPKEQTEEAGEAITIAENWLESNNFANDNNGFYGSSKADWFEMGGRWSGIFTEMQLPKPKLEKFYAEVKEIEEKHSKIWVETSKRLKGGSPEWIETHPKLDKAKQDEIVECWKKHFPKVKYAPPIARNGTFTFKDFPRKDNDDAVLMDEKLFRIWKRQYGGVEYVDIEAYEERLVKDLKFEDVKNKYVVVVDYHT